MRLLTWWYDYRVRHKFIKNKRLKTGSCSVKGKLVDWILWLLIQKNINLWTQLIFCQKAFQSDFYFSEMATKSTFYFATPRSYMKIWIKLKPMYKQPVPLVTFKPTNLEATGSNHTVSDSVFKVTRPI